MIKTLVQTAKQIDPAVVVAASFGDLNPLVTQIVELVKGVDTSVEATSDASESDQRDKNLVSLAQHLQLKEQEARILQEAAIAYRIATSAVVEINESYEAGGEGSLGVKSGAEGLAVGLAGSAKKITNRTYTFTQGEPPRKEDTVAESDTEATEHGEDTAEGKADSDGEVSAPSLDQEPADTGR